MIWFLLGVIFLLSLIYLVKMEIRDEKEPPGVRGIRALLILIRVLRDHKFGLQAYMNRRYGDIAQLTLPDGSRTVFLGSHQLLKEGFSKNETADRSAGAFAHAHGLLATNGHIWREQRRFALSTLRDFGMGKSIQEELILHEVEDLVKEFAKHNDSFDPRFYIGCAVTNVISATTFSDRYQYGDPKLDKFMTMITANLSAPARPLATLIPVLQHLPSVKANLDMIRENRAMIGQTLTEYVEEHRKTFSEGNIRDFLDAYIAVQIQEKDKEDSTFTEPQLMETIMDLFVAGSETTGTTLRWALAIMALNNDVQNKVFVEIMDVIGNERMPNMNDKVKMPYTEAVLLEVQRYGTTIPAIGHVVNTTCTIADYEIKKGSSVVCSFLNLNHDKRVWQYPDEFNVDNFMKDGNIINRQYFIPFSVGKRSCLGESLAKMETFLFFVALIQKFEFFFGEGEEPDLEDPDVGLVRMPKPYNIKVRTRA